MNPKNDNEHPDMASAAEIVRLLTAIYDLLRTKEERESSPHTPYKEKGETKNKRPPRAHAREEFKKPTVEEVAAHIREKGYVFDAEEFWNYYEAAGWRIGRHVMRSWKSACVTWQKKREQKAKDDAERTAHIDAKMDERTAHIDAKMDEREKKREASIATRRRPINWIGCTEEQMKDFCDGLA